MSILAKSRLVLQEGPGKSRQPCVEQYTMTRQPIISKFFKRVKRDEFDPASVSPKVARKVIDLKEIDYEPDNATNRPTLHVNSKKFESLPIVDVEQSDDIEEENDEINDGVNEENHGGLATKACKRTMSDEKDSIAEKVVDVGGDAINNNPAPNKRSKTVGSDFKLTPLDQQIKDLKQSNMDKLLVVRVGYKYKCFAQDAAIASSILHIKLIAGKLTFDNSDPQDTNHKQFAYCSFPDTRLNVHLERLVHHDLKVGVVEQSETSAIKKYSKDTNKNQVFKRRITNTFSKATYGINNTFSQVKGPVLGDSTSIWALSVTSKPNNHFAYKLISANLNNGEVTYDTFEENSSAVDKLNARLKYLNPKEMVIDQELPGRLKKLFERESCVVHIRSIPKSPNAKIKSICDELNLSETHLNMGSILHEYLEDYGNEELLLLPSTYKPFVSKAHILLNSNAFESLDIFSNDGSKGSLFWILDHTRTSFGSRQLKEWVLKPLLNKLDIEDRLDAIECIKSEINHLFFESLNRILKGSPDLLRTLNRITYGSTSRKEVFHFLKQLSLFISHFETHSAFLQRQLSFGDENICKKSKLLTNILSQMVAYSKNSIVTLLLPMINASAVMQKDVEKQIVEFFNLNNYDHSEKIIQRQRHISAVQDELSDELLNIRKLLHRPHMDYKDKVDYLIEIRNTQVKGLPLDWVKVNNTKMVSRFHTPTTMRLIEKLQYHKDLLLHEANEEFNFFSIRIKKEYSSLRDYIKNIGIYDAILALAATSCNQNYVRPRFTDKKQFIKATNARNPVIESLDISYVPNDISMSEEDGKVLILTGPNMGGKSSYVRQVALLVILAQIGSFVPADFFELSIFDSIFTRIGAYDNILQGESTFKVEMTDIMQIIEGYTSGSLLLLDEVGRGTSTEDGKAIAYSLVKYFLDLPDCPLILFTTHYPTLASISNDQLRNYYMDYIEEKKSGQNWSSVVFLYKLRPGTASNSFGLNVAKLAGIDSVIINRAFEVSETMRRENESNSNMALPYRLKNTLSSKSITSNQKLMQLLEISEDIELPIS